MIDSLLLFLWANLTPQGTFRAYWDARDTLEDNNVFISLLFLDAVHPFRGRYARLDSLADTVMAALLRHRPPGDMWRYWIDRWIPPDFDDISLAGVVLPKYGISVDSQAILDSIEAYTVRRGGRRCVVMFKDENSLRRRLCDCVVNVNVLRFNRDTSLCPFIRRCVRNPHSYTYLHPKAFMLYFLAHARREGSPTCGIDVEGELRKFLSDTLSEMNALLAYTTASILGVSAPEVEALERYLLDAVGEDGGMPMWNYFTVIEDEGGRYVFFGRTLPTILLLEGLLSSLPSGTH